MHKGFDCWLAQLGINLFCLQNAAKYNVNKGSADMWLFHLERIILQYYISYADSISTQSQSL